LKSVWLTYAWDDNKSGDIDFIAQELSSDLIVKLDRWNLTAGKRLWEQIESFICDPEKSEGWIIYATQSSLLSEKCKEEYAYALDRALSTRGKGFPVIGLFPSSVDDSLIPRGIKSRLYVNLRDPDWKERIVSAVEGRSPDVEKRTVQPYHMKIHSIDKRENKYALEVRPRAGVWSTFIIAIPFTEKDKVSPHIRHGSSNKVPGTSILHSSGKGQSNDGKWYHMNAGNEASPTQSYYMLCKELPSKIIFGVNGGAPQYCVSL